MRDDTTKMALAEIDALSKAPKFTDFGSTTFVGDMAVVKLRANKTCTMTEGERS
jgi:hypothetical protein